MPGAMKISSVKVALHSSYMKIAVSVNITKEKGTKNINNMEYHNIQGMIMSYLPDDMKAKFQHE